MTQRQETEAKQRLIEATNLLIETLNLLRDAQRDGTKCVTQLLVGSNKLEYIEDKIRKFLKAPT